jgi:hypothetical protein
VREVSRNSRATKSIAVSGRRVCVYLFTFVALLLPLAPVACTRVASSVVVPTFYPRSLWSMSRPSNLASDCPFVNHLSCHFSPVDPCVDRPVIVLSLDLSGGLMKGHTVSVAVIIVALAPVMRFVPGRGSDEILGISP